MRGERSRWLVGLVAFVVLLTGAGWLVIRGLGERDRHGLDRGDGAYRRGDWRAAEARARSILKSRSSDREALRLLARSAARQGREDSAEAIYRRLGTGFMEAEDYFLLGHALLGRGQVAPGLACLGAARDAQPDHPETLDALSRYWAETGTMADAVQRRRTAGEATRLGGPG